MYVFIFCFSWLLLQAFESVHAGTISDGALTDLHLSFASQLEGLGLWKWSVFVCLFIQDYNIKKNTVLDILFRNLEVPTTEESLALETGLINDFNLPISWIHTVKGHKNMSLYKHHEACVHFCHAKLWHEAHRIATSVILPDLILNAQYGELHSVLDLLHKGRDHLPTWDDEEGVYGIFLSLYETLIAYDTNDATAGLVIQEKINNFCEHIVNFPKTTLIQAICVAEMSKTLCGLVLENFRSDFLSGKSYSLLKVISNFPLPADYKKDELDKLIIACATNCIEFL